MNGGHATTSKNRLNDINWGARDAWSSAPHALDMLHGENAVPPFKFFYPHSVKEILYYRFVAIFS